MPEATDPHALNQPGLTVVDDHAPGKDARMWLEMITDAEKTFRDYQAKADNIDKLYSDLSYLSNGNRDREFALFWANVQVLGPSIYSRPPVPVVVPRFKDRRPLHRQASELLERCGTVAFEIADIDQTMLLVRDDLTIAARGAAWVRYETKDGEKVCIEHIDRKDFLHEPARNWSEVSWVARRAWMSRSEAEERFPETWVEMTFDVRRDDKDNGGTDDTAQAGIWEIWHKRLKRVVWVSEGCEVILDSGKPHLTLEGFFPCPRPAFATTQRRSLIPVPDMVFYRDQLEEINSATRRISALTEGLRLKGLYPAGQGDIGDAVETAMSITDDRKLLIPVANAAQLFSNGGELVVWLPLDMVATTIQTLIAIRKELIDDVYQITGLSDIMRGSTDANETLGAQELKSQYGSVRIRDRQAELVRLARDLVRIVAEIQAENFSARTMLEMSQLDIPKNADIKRQQAELRNQAEDQLRQQAAQAEQDPDFMKQVEENPSMLEQMAQQAKQQMDEQLKPQLQKLSEVPTVEAVVQFLRDQRLRPFVLDIETDSTISADENAQKERANEFITALGGYLGQAAQLAELMPQSIPVIAEGLKFVASQYRAGRQMEGAIEEFADQMKQQAAQPQGNPEADAAQAEAKAKADALAQEQQRQALKDQAETERAKRDEKRKDAELQRSAQRDEFERDMKIRDTQDAATLRERETGEKIALIQEQRANSAEKHRQEMERGALDIERTRADISRVESATENAVIAAQAKASQPKPKASA